MELVVRQFRWQEQFHGIPWKFGCTNFDDSSSSMEFHGIPLNSGCANFADTSSSMEFYSMNLKCATFADTRSSMEFDGTWSAPISLTREVPWNSMELGVRQFRWHEQFHGIPWNLEYANFNDTSSSMEFHGTRSAPISLTQAVPWNSMELRMRQFCWHEQFHWIPWNSMEFEMRQFLLKRAVPVPWNSMELGVRQFRWHEHAVPWNSMEFHGTQGVPISLTRAVPWNSMGLGVRQFCWH